MTPDLRGKICEKNAMYKATLSDPQNKELLVEYKKNKNSLNSQFKNTEILYNLNELDINKHDASKSWKILKNNIGTQGGNYSQKKTFSIDNVIIDNSEKIANEFNNFFVSIGHNKFYHTLINNSFYHGIFPDELKLARVVQILKSGDSIKIYNYRPISILPFFSQKYMFD